jgi:hypothetical protein
MSDFLKQFDVRALVESTIKRRDRQLVLYISIFVVFFVGLRGGELDINQKDFLEKVFRLIALLLAINFGYSAIVWILDKRREIAKKHSNRAEYFKIMRAVANRDGLGLGVTKKEKEVELEKYFVEPALKRAKYKGDKKRFADHFLDLHTIVKIASRAGEGIVLAGPGGSGKTVLARWLADQISNPENHRGWSFLLKTLSRKEVVFENLNWFEKIIFLFHAILIYLELEIDKDYETFPYAVFVSLPDKNILPPDKTGINLIVACLENSLDQTFAKRQNDILKMSDQLKNIADWLAAGMMIPIFDGLDTLKPGERKRFIEGLKEFSTTFSDCVPYVLTVRDVDVDLGEYAGLRASFWEVQPFNQDKIIHYLDNLLGEQKKDELWNTIKGAAEKDASVWTLIANPLFLGLLASSYISSARTRHPDNDIDRISIYREYFYKLWVRKSENLFQKDFPESNLARAAYRSLQAGNVDFNLDKVDPQTLVQLEDLFLKKTEQNQFRFIQTSFHAFFAATYIFAQFVENDAKDFSRPILDGALGMPSYQDKNDGDVEVEIPNPVQCREALIFVCEMFVQNDKVVVTNNMIVHPLIASLVHKLYFSEKTVSKILLLRLVGLLERKKNGNRDSQNDMLLLSNFICQNEHRESFNPESDLTRLVLSWLFTDDAVHGGLAGLPVDFADVGYGLPFEVWEKLEEQSVRTSGNMDDTLRERTLYLISCLHHPRAVKFIIRVACEKFDIPEKALQEINRMGLLMVSPWLESYNEALREKLFFKQRMLIRLLGYISLNKELKKNVGRIIESPASEELAQEALDALANSRDLDSEYLMSLFYKMGEKLRPNFVQVMTIAYLKDIPQEKLVNLLGDWRKQKSKGRRLDNLLLKDMAVEIIQNKLNPNNKYNQESDFIDLINKQHRFYDPKGNGRRLLGFLWKHKNLRWLYEAVRWRYRPRKDFLDSMLDICGGVNSDQAKYWVVHILQDYGLEVRYKAVDVFVKKSKRMANKFEWLNQIAHMLPEEVVIMIEKRLGQ